MGEEAKPYGRWADLSLLWRTSWCLLPGPVLRSFAQARPKPGAQAFQTVTWPQSALMTRVIQLARGPLRIIAAQLKNKSFDLK